jgi:ABC-type branched-subunit amino acid transport system substrate-binding protein
MRKVKLLALAVGLLGLSLLVVACGGGSSSGTTGQSDGGGGSEGASLDLTIGDSAPLTGELAAWGPSTEKSSDLAVSEINAAIGKAGVDQQVSITHADNCGGSDQQCAVQSVRQLASSSGASCIVGPWASSDVMAAAEAVAIPDKTMLILPASTASEISELDDAPGYVSRTAYADSFEGLGLAEYINKAIGGAKGKTVNIGAQNDAWGTGFAKAFTESWESIGGTVGKTVIYDPNLASYDTEAEEVMSGEADATVILDYPETYAKVGPALVRTGKFDPETTFFPDALASTETYESASAAATVGVRGVVPGLDEASPEYKAFVKAFESFPPKNVETMAYNAQTFDATMLCYLAAAAADSTDPTEMAEALVDVSAPPGKPYTWLQLPEAVEALAKGEDIDFQGISGKVDLNENGDPSAASYDVYQFKSDGSTEVVDRITIDESGT